MPVEDSGEKNRVLKAFTNHIVRGRWNDVRPPTEMELKATSVLALPLEEVSAKVRTGPPKDDEEDYALPIWAGVLPLPVVPGAPIPDPRVECGPRAAAERFEVFAISLCGLRWECGAEFSCFYFFPSASVRKRNQVNRGSPTSRPQ